MFLGHYGIAFAARRVAPRTSLGTTIFAVELSLFALGLAFYLRATRARDRVGSWGLWAMVALLTFFFLGSLMGAPPPNEHVLALTALGLWIFVPWGYWVDRHREPRQVPY
jgi:hypothetical protein